MPSGPLTDRYMKVTRLGQPQRPLQGDLARRRVEQIGPADDVRDVLRGVIKDDGKLVGKQPVGAPQNEISHAGGHVLALAALGAVVETDIACGHARSAAVCPAEVPARRCPDNARRL